jgi:hypothetical protein
MKNAVTDLQLLVMPTDPWTCPPFQTVSYPSFLEGSDYLGTLLQCYWIIEMLTSGIEMSAFAPFNIRSADSLLSRLPESLRVPPRRRSSGCLGGVYVLEITSLQSPKVYSDDHVQSLVDVEIELIAPGADVDSPEALFAAAFNENYSIITSVFPEFIRLAELVKVTSICRFFASVRRDQVNLMDPDSRMEAVHDALRDILDEIGDDRWNALHRPGFLRDLVDLISGAYHVKTNIHNLVYRMLQVGDIPRDLVRICAEDAAAFTRRDRQPFLRKLNAIIGEARENISSTDRITFLPSPFVGHLWPRFGGGITLSFEDETVSSDARFSMNLSELPPSPLFNIPDVMDGVRTSGSAWEIVISGISHRFPWQPRRPKGSATDEPVFVKLSPSVHAYLSGYTGEVPSADTQALMWKMRMRRLQCEVRYELSQLADSEKTESYRAPAIVAQRGYELSLDLVSGTILQARELSWKEQKKMRKAHGLPPL